MNKFKVGDKVRVNVKPNSYAGLYFKPDQVVTLKKCFAFNSVVYICSIEESDHHVYTDDITLVHRAPSTRKIKVGDWIAYTGETAEGSTCYGGWYKVLRVQRKILIAVFYGDLVSATGNKDSLPFTKNIKFLNKETVKRNLIKDLL